MNNRKKISIENFEVSYLEEGVGDRTLIMIHGNSMSKESFHAQLQSTLKKTFRLLSVDLPGHGETVSLNSNPQLYTVPGLKSFLIDFIRAIGIDKCILLGHSLGGHLAIEASAELTEVCGVMAWSTPPLSKNVIEISPFANHPGINLIFSENLDELEIKTLSKAYWSKLSEPPSIIAEKITQTDPIFRSTLSKSFTAGEWDDEVEIIKDVSFPVALALGEYDELINRQYIKDVAEQHIWEMKLHIIPDAGHSPHMENPDYFNSWIEEFVKTRS